MNRAIAEQLYKHAQHNYEKDGWDFVVECLTVDDIIEDLIRENITTIENAIKYYENIYGTVNEQREEIQKL